VAAIPAGVFVVLSAHPAAARTAAIIYACGLAGLYGISSSYHRLARSPRARYWMRRLDHSMIYVFIAASCTPFALVALHGAWAISVLVAVWAGAVAGVVLKMLRLERSAKLGFTMYLVLGWAMVVATPAMLHRVSAVDMLLVLLGGIAYTVGAVILATGWPDPVPSIFGYHEVWHTLVVAATGLQYVAIRSVLATAH
jgi:hemolysin III